VSMRLYRATFSTLAVALSMGVVVVGVQQSAEAADNGHLGVSKSKSKSTSRSPSRDSSSRPTLHQVTQLLTRRGYNPKRLDAVYRESVGATGDIGDLVTSFSDNEDVTVFHVYQVRGKLRLLNTTSHKVYEYKPSGKDELGLDVSPSVKNLDDGGLTKYHPVTGKTVTYEELLNKEDVFFRPANLRTPGRQVQYGNRAETLSQWVGDQFTPVTATELRTLIEKAAAETANQPSGSLPIKWGTVRTLLDGDANVPLKLDVSVRRGKAIFYTQGNYYTQRGKELVAERGGGKLRFDQLADLHFKRV
jgi:hypothetical protein